MNNLTQLDTPYPGPLARIARPHGQGAVAVLQQFFAAWKRRRLARQTLIALHKLDARTLRDLGFDRSELVSVAAEVSGDAEGTRARLLTTVPRMTV